MKRPFWFSRPEEYFYHRNMEEAYYDCLRLFPKIKTTMTIDVQNMNGLWKNECDTLFITNSSHEVQATEDQVERILQNFPCLKRIIFETEVEVSFALFYEVCSCRKFLRHYQFLVVFYQFPVVHEGQLDHQGWPWMHEERGASHWREHSDRRRYQQLYQMLAEIRRKQLKVQAAVCQLRPWTDGRLVEGSRRETGAKCLFKVWIAQVLRWEIYTNI